MAQAPLISIVTPVYNTEKYLSECLDSIFAQTMPDIELICVDDGSTDNSLNILKDYQKKHKNLKVISQKNGGPGVARNTGIDNATGKYICFWDSDDIFEPDTLEKLYNQAEKTKADITICRMQMFNTQTGQIIPIPLSIRSDLLNGKSIFSYRDVPQHIFQISVGWAEDKLFLNKFVKQHNLRFPPFKSSEDTAFTLSAIIKAERITYIDDILISYRVKNAQSVSNNRHKSSSAFYESLKIIRDEAQKDGIYNLIEQSFINLALHFSLWHVNSMRDKKVKKQLAHNLKHQYFIEFGINKHSKSYFYNQDEYKEYLFKYHPHAFGRRIKHNIRSCADFLKSYLLFPWYTFKIYQEIAKRK